MLLRDIPGKISTKVLRGRTDLELRVFKLPSPMAIETKTNLMSELLRSIAQQPKRQGASKELTPTMSQASWTSNSVARLSDFTVSVLKRARHARGNALDNRC